MLVKDLKSLEELLKLLRKAGITEFKMDGIDLKLGDEPKKRAYRKTEAEEEETNPFAGLMPSDEELAFFSVPTPLETPEGN